jgi:hypothetical protein
MKPRTWLTALFASACSIAAAQWTPPADPDPIAILREAQADADSGRYADALDKHRWIHGKSLQLNAGMGGVRLSFALSQWRRLGEKYPPALDALRAVRDEAANQVRTRERAFSEFHDFASISRTLGEDAATAELFAWVDANKPAEAQQYYHVAQPSLVVTRNYALCGKYLNGAAEADRIIGMHRMNRSLQVRQGAAAFSDFAKRSFTSEATTLVALLAVNARKAEADKAIQKFLKEWPDDGFRAQLNQALGGAVPEPWPPRI